MDRLAQALGYVLGLTLVVITIVVVVLLGARLIEALA